MSRLVGRTALAWLGLTILQAVIGGLLLPRTPAPRGAAGWSLVALSNALEALVAVLLASRMAGPGWRRSLTLFAVVGGVQANMLVEAVFFSLDIPRAILPALFLESLVLALAFALLVDRLSGAASAGRNAWPAGRGARSWAVRIAVCDLAYVAAYFGAGLLVFPFVRSFYAGRPMPGLAPLFLMQVARGLVFTGLVLLIVRRVEGRRATVAALAGLTLSILGGVAPLLLPNPYMPDAVRLAHLCEVGTSNLLFGWLAALLLASREAPRPPAAERLTAGMQ